MRASREPDLTPAQLEWLREKVPHFKDAEAAVKKARRDEELARDMLERVQ